MTLKFRIGKLEAAPALRGFTSSKAVRKAQDLTAIRNRCRLLLEVTDEEAEREELQRTIAEIDEGRYQLGEPLPADQDCRAKIVRERLLAQFG